MTHLPIDIAYQTKFRVAIFEFAEQEPMLQGSSSLHPNSDESSFSISDERVASNYSVHNICHRRCFTRVDRIARTTQHFGSTIAQNQYTIFVYSQSYKIPGQSFRFDPLAIPDSAGITTTRVSSDGSTIL